MAATVRVAAKAEGSKRRPDEAQLRARLDVWLWRVRVVKTRALAAKLVASGHIRVNGVKSKAPGRGLMIGDVLTVALDRTVRVLKVREFGERRGSATQARGLYDDLSPALGASAVEGGDGRG